MLLKKKSNIPKATYFGLNLKFLRRLNGMTQSELAKVLGASRSNIASYESGIVEPKAEVFILACSYFKTAPRIMLETILSKSPVVEIDKDSNTSITVDKFLLNEFDQFVVQTNNYTKILDGYIAYNTFYSKDSSASSASSKDMRQILDDLISLSESLIKLNWELINSFVSSDNEEE